MLIGRFQLQVGYTCTSGGPKKLLRYCILPEWKQNVIEKVNEDILNQTDKPQLFLAQREIAKEIGFSKTLVHEIVKKDLA